MDNLFKVIFIYLVIHLAIFVYQEYSRPMSVDELDKIYKLKLNEPPTEEECKEWRLNRDTKSYPSRYIKHCFYYEPGDRPRV